MTRTSLRENLVSRGKQKNNMANRIPKVNELIKREISKMILKEIEFPKDVLVTVTRVQTSSNLSDSNIYISVLPENRYLQPDPVPCIPA